MFLYMFIYIYPYEIIMAMYIDDKFIGFMMNNSNKN